MSKLELIRELYEHNEWANGRILDTAAKASEADLRSRPPSSYTSIMADLAHIAHAQATWLSRWKMGITDPSARALEELDTLADLRTALAKSHAELRDYLSGLTDAALDGGLSYTDLRRGQQEWPLWRMLIHVANHNSFHRGEIALCLTALGESPGELDILHFLRQRRQALPGG